MNARFTLSLLLLSLVAAGWPEAASAEVVVVTTANDISDGDTGSIAALIADPGPDGKISLREAIHAANNTSGTDEIRFLIGGAPGQQSIPILNPLPAIADPIRILGTCAGGSDLPCVQLRRFGTLLFDGLVVTAGQSVVEGLLLNNFKDGLVLRGGGGNVVKRCYVGVDFGGGTAAGNQVGIRIESGQNEIGTGSPGEGNLVSGNAQAGATGILITGASATSNQIKGNLIGTNSDGTAPLPNKFGIRITEGASNNTIGGTSVGARNVISGNTQFDGVGILIESPENQVLGNYVGTNAAGTDPLANDRGVLLRGESAFGNVIGGADAGARNVISGNGLSGVSIEQGDDNRVLGNYIGTNAAGTAALANGIHGVYLILGAVNNVIGGAAFGAGNVIAGNGQYGVEIVNSSTSSNRVLGNYIGTNREHADLGNGQGGVGIIQSPNNRIGLPGPGNSNVIGFNRVGIEIRGEGAQGNEAQNNFIGTDSDMAALGNDEEGVLVIGAASGNMIGGDVGNVIAHNGQDGITVGASFGGDLPEGIAIRRNRIHSNGALGIDLGTDAVTANDAGDGDDGPNALQNFPVLNGATVTSGGLAVEGFLSSQPNTLYHVEFFSSAAADPSGHGEGQRYLGALDVTTDALGVAQLAFTGSAVAVGHFISATATDPDGNTSEFSSAVAVTDDTPGLTVTFDNDLGDDDMAQAANWDTDELPTGNDTAVIPAGSTAVLLAGDALQVRQLDVFGAVGSPTTFTLLGTLTAEVVRQFAFTTVEVDGGTAVVEEWTNTGGATVLADAATLTSKLGDGAFTATSGATVAATGTEIAVDLDVTTTNATFSGAPGAEVSFTGSSIWNAGTDLLNVDPVTGEVTYDLNGPTTVAGDTDVGLGVTVTNYDVLDLGFDLRAGAGGAGSFVNAASGVVDVTGTEVTIGTFFGNDGSVSVPAGSGLTLNGGGVFDYDGDGGSSITVEDFMAWQRTAGSSAEYDFAGGTVSGSGDVEVRAPLSVGDGATFDPNLTVRVSGSEAQITRTGTEPLMLPDVEVMGTGGVIDGGNPTPDPDVPDVTIASLTDGTDPNTADLTLANGTFAVPSFDVPATSTWTNLTLDNANVDVTGQAVVNDFFDFEPVFGDNTGQVVIPTTGSLVVGNQATLTFRVPLIVVRNGLQHGTVFVGSGSTMELFGGGNLQGGERQLVLGAGARVVVGAAVGSTSTVNFSTVPTTDTPQDEAVIELRLNGEIDFSGGAVDAQVYFKGGTVLPQPVVVYLRLVIYESGRTLAGSVFRGGITAAGPNGFPVEADATVEAGGPATFGTDVAITPGFSLTIGNGGVGEISGFHDFNIGTAAARGMAARRGTAERRGALGLRGGALARGGAGASGGDVALVVEAGGQFSKTGGGVTDLFVPVANAGALLAEEGTFVVRSTLDSPGLLGGNGAFDVTNGTVTVAGPVSPGLSAGTLTWTGDYAPAATSSLVVELGGLAPGTEHDVLAVSGAATLAGALDLRLLDGYVPEVGDAFAVLTAASVTGAFSEVLAPPGYTFDVTLGATEVVVEATSVPAPPAVVVTAEPENPPVVLPPSGGTFRYRVTLTNATDQPQTMQGWVEAVLPNGTAYGPLLGPKTVTLQAGQTLGPVRFRQRVPAAAPPGEYQIRVRVGDYPDTVVSEDTFTFEKEAPPSALRSGEALAGRDARQATEAAVPEGWESEELTDGEPLLAAKAAPEPEAATVPEAAPASAQTLPEVVALHPAAPNPFGQATTLRFDLPEAGPVRLVVYDVLGRAVARLVDGEVEAGFHAVVLDGRGLASGPYVVRLEAGGAAAVQRITLVR